MARSKPRASVKGGRRGAIKSWVKHSVGGGRRSAVSRVSVNTVTDVIGRRDQARFIKRTGRVVIPIYRNGDTTSVTASFGSGFAAYQNLSGLVTGTSSWSTLSTQYDQFRVVSVEFDYVPLNSSAITENYDEQVGVPTVLTYDLDNITSSPATVAAALDYENAKVVMFDKLWNQKYIIPGVTYGSASTGYSFPNKWFDTRSPGMMAGVWALTCLPSPQNAQGGAVTNLHLGNVVATLQLEYRNAI